MGSRDGFRARHRTPIVRLTARALKYISGSKRTSGCEGTDARRTDDGGIAADRHAAAERFVDADRIGRHELRFLNPADRIVESYE